MSTNLTIRQQLFEKFRNRNRRRSFAEQDLGSSVAAQIYALRQKHGWTQEKLAEATEMSQARISVMENPNYRKFNVGTLQRIAAAFDVALIVRFVSFGELLDWTVQGSQTTLAPLNFDEEFPDEIPAVAAHAAKGNLVSLDTWAKTAEKQQLPSEILVGEERTVAKRQSGLAARAMGEQPSSARFKRAVG